MAEIFGVVAGAVGLIALLPKLTLGVEMLRQIRDKSNTFPTDIAALASHLELLVIALEALRHAPGISEPALFRCTECCKMIADDLDRVKGMVQPFVLDNKQNTRIFRRITGLPGLRTAIEQLRQSIDRAQSTMTLTSQVPLLQMMSRLAFLPLPPAPETQSSTEDLLFIRANNDTEEDVIGRTRQTRHPRWRPNVCGTGSTQSCNCSCHRQTTMQGTSWRLSYAFSTAPCYAHACQSRVYGASLRIPLTRWGINWSVIVQGQVIQEAGMFSVRPGLTIHRTIPNDSAGFLVLKRLGNFEITLDEAKSQLTVLNQSDPTFKDHVNEYGLSYLQMTTSYSGVNWHEWRSKLLVFLIQDLELNRGLFESDIISMMLHGTYCTDIIPYPELYDWVSSSDNIWDSYKCPSSGLSPSGLPQWLRDWRYLRREDNGCEGMTSLHHAVLFNKTKEFQHWLPRLSPDTRNTYGQTPLHLAFQYPDLIQALVDAGHDVNALDRGGNSPLENASVMGCTQAARMLLDAGAHVSRAFEYAADFYQWSFILSTFPKVEELFGCDIRRDLARMAARSYFKGLCLDSEHASAILDAHGPLSFRYADDKNNTLFHYVRQAEHVQLFLDHGSVLEIATNDKGRHALLEFASQFEYYDSSKDLSHLLAAFIGAGCEVNLQDIRGRTTLRHTLEKWAECYNFSCWNYFVLAVSTLLSKHADISIQDYCRCPCSPGGCFPFVALCQMPYKIHKALDWFQLVVEHRDQNAARDFLMACLRAIKFQELGMTHVCCRRRTISEEDKQEILEEEDEFIQLLDKDMDEIQCLDYQALEDLWFSRVKVLLDKECTANDNNCDCRSCRVDNRRCPTCPWRRVANEAAEYRVWVEIKYGFNKAGHVAADTQRLCYSSRVHRLDKLSNVLGINMKRDLDWFRGEQSHLTGTGYENWADLFGIEEPPDHSPERLFDLIHGKGDTAEGT